VAQIDPTQGPNGLLYGSYLGGGSDTSGLDMAIDGSEDVFRSALAVGCRGTAFDVQI
jgi:hypothetical protein